jgi:hypothetical protein
MLSVAQSIQHGMVKSLANKTNNKNSTDRNLCPNVAHLICSIHFANYCFLGCDAMKSGNYLSHFPRNTLPPSSGPNSKNLKSHFTLLGSWTLSIIQYSKKHVLETGSVSTLR